VETENSSGNLVLAVIASPFCLLRAQALAAESRSVWDGVYTEEQAKRGESVYRKECAACHGDLLAGAESAPPLTGGAFLANWNGLTIGDLFDRIRKTMPQSAPGRLTRQQKRGHSGLHAERQQVSGWQNGTLPPVGDAQRDSF